MTTVRNSWSFDFDEQSEQVEELRVPDQQMLVAKILCESRGWPFLPPVRTTYLYATSHDAVVLRSEIGAWLRSEGHGDRQDVPGLDPEHRFLTGVVVGRRSSPEVRLTLLGRLLRPRDEAVLKPVDLAPAMLDSYLDG